MPRIRKAAQSSAPTEPFWKVGAYIRLSKEDEKADDSESITNQKKIIEAYIEEHFPRDRYTLAGIYADDGRTGTDIYRPEYQRLLGDMLGGKVNCMIVKSLSRAFRNLGDQEKFTKEFVPTYGIRLISISQPYIDSYLHPHSIKNLEVSIHGLFNDRYAEATSESVRKTFDMKRSRGEFIGAFAPYGYEKDAEIKGHLVIDENAAPVVRNIFDWFVNGGYSKRGIASRLNELGEPNPSAYKEQSGKKYRNPKSSVNDGLWGTHAVTGILSNAVYTGAMVQGRNRIISYKVHKQISVPESEWFVVPGTHEAIVDDATFEKAQQLQLRDTRTAPNEKTVHIFSGLVRCPDCGKAMHRKVARGIRYLYCRSYTDKKVCSKHAIREDRLESIVLQTLRKQIELADMIPEEIERINRLPAKSPELARLTGLLSKTKQALAFQEKVADNAYLDWKRGDISREQFLRLSEDAAKAIEKHERSIEAIKAEMQSFENGANAQNPYLKAFLEHRNIHTLNRGILISLIDTIWVYEGGEVMIDLKFADQYRPMLEYFDNNRNTTDAEQKAAT